MEYHLNNTFEARTVINLNLYTALKQTVTIICNKHDMTGRMSWKPYCDSFQTWKNPRWKAMPAQRTLQRIITYDHGQNLTEVKFSKTEPFAWNATAHHF